MTEDIRWRKVYGHIKKVDHRKDTMEVLLEVSFEGHVFVSRLRLWELDLFEEYKDILDEMVRRLDQMMTEYGYPPYEIRSV